MRKLSIYAVLVIALLVQPMAGIDLPPAPGGFEWQQVPEIKAAFLKPNGWFFKHEKQKGTLAYFITKESIANGGEFQTGLTVNVFPRMNGSPVERGRGLIEQIAQKHHAKLQSQTAGPFLEFSCEVTDTDASGSYVMHYLAVANPKTNTLYMFIFESPKSSWATAWANGEQIFNMLALDDEV